METVLKQVFFWKVHKVKAQRCGEWFVKNVLISVAGYLEDIEKVQLKEQPSLSSH